MSNSVVICSNDLDELLAHELGFGKIYKYEEGKSESGEETFNYRLIFKKHDGKWYLNYFIIV